MTTKQERRFVRTKQQQDPTRGRKHWPSKPVEHRRIDKLQSAINEWADDYAGDHSIFED